MMKLNLTKARAAVRLSPRRIGQFGPAAIGLWLMLSLGPASAQLLSVDINGTVRSDVTTPGFTPWYVAGDLSGAKTTSVSRSFTNYVYTYDPDSGLPTSTNVGSVIACTIAMTVPATADATHYLNASYANKNGNSTSADPNAGWRLAEDGCWSHWKDDSLAVDQPNPNGGAIRLTIAGLSAGVHSITTYHNDPWATNTSWHGNHVLSRCLVSANGVPVFTNAPTAVATNDSQCGFAFFYVTNSYDGQPVVLNFDPDHSSVLDFTILNGFEIDRPFAPGTTATAIFPLPDDEHAFAHNDLPLPGTASAGWLTLQWRPAAFAISNDLYFGTNPVAVANATTASPEYLGATVASLGTTNRHDVTNLNSALTYYWRVDQLDLENGATNRVTGTVWKFRTRHLAFPGAEGYGRFARGGRGGRVIEVTNLNDSGPGSYRAAIEASGPRTVVFKVSGLIRLQSPCVIGNGSLTVAGQTAPGEGICLANYRAGMTSCSDVIMRFMRCRLGDAARKAMDGIGLGNATHSIMDHCSISWTMDECTSSRQSGAVGSESAMISNQHNLLSEPLRYSYHYAGQSITSTNYEPHAFAGSISGEIGSYHHDLIAHSTDRNWSLAGGLDQSVHYAGSLDIRNNVIYNWRGRTTDGGVARLNYVNNYYKPARTNLSIACSWLLRLDPINTNWGTEYIYMTGNVWEGKSYYANNWMAGSFANGLPLTNLVVSSAELYPSYVETQSASNAYKVVLSDVGCNLPVPDLIDQRVIGEVLDGTTHYEGTNGDPYIVNGVVQATSGHDDPGFIDSQTDVHDYSTDPAAPNYSPNAPWGPYRTFNVPLDSDHDGMPDWWEQIKGLNPHSPANDFSDANTDLVGDGYTELERYLNWLARPHYDCTNGTALNVDLAQYTRGFTNAGLGASYAVFGAVNGSVTLSGRTARFDSIVSTNGLGGFFFKVTDNTGFSYTNSVNVRLLTVGSPANSAPVLAAINDRTINVGVNLLVTNKASDADTPAQTLTYDLSLQPTNATIDAVSGVLHWRPLVSQANTTNPFSVVVTDNGLPNLSATQSFTVIVNPLTRPSVMGPSLADGQMGLTVNGQLGPDYAVQTSSNLLDWSTILVTNPAVMPFSWSTNAVSSPAQFYRLQVGPPLP
jgi:hypothetical protein